MVWYVDCYAVPHSEKTEEQYVAINKDYHKSMLTARKHITRREVIVGWFSTTTSAGEIIVDNSSLIHDFYSRECVSPVHVVVDTTLAGDGVGVRAFVSAPMTAGPHTFAHMFHEVAVRLEMAPYEAICIGQMTRGQRILSEPWKSSTVLAAIPSAEQSLTESMEKMLQLIDKTLAYVTAVVDGKQPAQADIGMLISDALGTTQSVRIEDFQAVFQAKTQDLLMAEYLTTLIQTQLTVAEKLNEII